MSDQSTARMTVLRWILLTPVVAAATLGGMFAVLLVVFVVANDYFECILKSRGYLCGPTPTLGVVFRFFEHAVPAALSTYLAARTAPTYKKTVLVILGVLWLLFAVYLEAAPPLFHNEPFIVVNLVVNVVAVGSGFAVAAWLVQRAVNRWSE